MTPRLYLKSGYPAPATMSDAANDEMGAKPTLRAGLDRGGFGLTMLGPSFSFSFPCRDDIPSQRIQ
jgi:hypothetical protein